MVALIKKKMGKQFYWYLVESKRVNGNPRITWQKYIGSADRLREIIEQGETGGFAEIDVKEFGPAPLLALAKELQIVETVDNLVPKRDQGYSVG